MNVVVRKLPGSTLSLYVEHMGFQMGYVWRIEVTPDNAAPYTATRATAAAASPRIASLEGLSALDKLTRDLGGTATAGPDLPEDPPQKIA